MTQDLSAAESLIHETLNKYEAAWNIHDAKAFASTFTEDADFTNVFGKRLNGRQPIEAQHEYIFATMFKSSHFTINSIHIRFLAEELAAVDVLWSMVGALDAAGNPWPERKGLLNLIMKNEDESWLILIMHNMDIVSMPSRPLSV